MNERTGESEVTDKSGLKHTSKLSNNAIAAMLDSRRKESMLATVSNVWWPRLHAKNVGIAETCPECQTDCKSVITLLKQSQLCKLPKILISIYRKI